MGSEIEREIERAEEIGITPVFVLTEGKMEPIAHWHAGRPRSDFWVPSEHHVRIRTDLEALRARVERLYNGYDKRGENMMREYRRAEAAEAKLRTALEWKSRADTNQKSLDMLYGEKFSDRSYAALKSRAEAAEARAEKAEEWKACIEACAAASGNMKLSKAIERTCEAMAPSPPTD